ncbi:MAG TPA: signal peptidase II [Stellaceae bacterium]|nr:signal peptidase II [Stellaceae bacterium]
MIRGLGIALFAAVVAGDQLSKSWIVSYLGDPERHAVQSIAPFFDLVLVRNRGVSFGLFNGDSAVNSILLSVVAGVVVLGLFVWLWRTRSALVAAATGLVSGGAVGNVIDRLRFGGVTDFLDFHWGEWHFPAFNLADSAITVGVGLLLIDGLLSRRESRK